MSRNARLAAFSLLTTSLIDAVPTSAAARTVSAKTVISAACSIAAASPNVGLRRIAYSARQRRTRRATRTSAEVRFDIGRHLSGAYLGKIASPALPRYDESVRSVNVLWYSSECARCYSISGAARKTTA